MIPSARPSGWTVALILTLGILSVSTAAIFIRLTFEAAGLQGAGFSLFIAATRLTLAAFILLPAWGSFRNARFQHSALLYSAAAGIFLALHFAAWITSLSYTSIVASTTLVTTNPVWVALLSWLWFKERPTPTSLCGIAIALAGGILVSTSGGSSSAGSSEPFLGDLLALAGSWAVSFYFLLGREAQRRGLSLGNHVVITYTTAAIALLPMPLLFGTGYSGYPTTVYLYIFLMALFPQVIGHTSFNWAVRWISPTLVTLTILAEPVGSSILGMMVFRENPGTAVLLGAAVILVGVAIAALGAKATVEP